VTERPGKRGRKKEQDGTVISTISPHPLPGRGEERKTGGKEGRGTFLQIMPSPYLRRKRGKREGEGRFTLSSEEKKKRKERCGIFSLGGWLPCFGAVEGREEKKEGILERRYSRRYYSCLEGKKAHAVLTFGRERGKKNHFSFTPLLSPFPYDQDGRGGEAYSSEGRKLS